MSGALSGPLLGVITLGMLAPRINGRSALLGLLAGQALCLFIVWNELGSDDFRELGTSIEGCSNFSLDFSGLNSTVVAHTEESAGRTATTVSHLLVPIMGFASTTIVALASSFSFGFNNPFDVDKNLLAKFVRDIYHPQFEEIVAQSNDFEVVVDGGVH